jgi:hypothetical protein
LRSLVIMSLARDRTIYRETNTITRNQILV